MSRPLTFRECSRQVIEAGANFAIAVRETLDSFYLALPNERLAVVRDAPLAALPKHYNLWMRAAVSQLGREYGFTPPTWARNRGYLEHPWFVSDIEGLKPWFIYSTPPEFIARNIFNGPRPLERAMKQLTEAEVRKLRGLPDA